jgi:HD superfamily phosphohydrolase
MSADAIAELAQAWYTRIEGLEGAVNQSLDRIGFTEEYVLQMKERPRHPPGGPRSKVVKDNVWGMVELDRSAQLLLDCPVVQRLRRIRQLGLTYLTYPSAEHTRFSHSLGMYCVIHQLLGSIRKNQAEAARHGGKIHGHDYWPLTEALSSDLLHASILHDIGHMPFSHATERAVTTHQDYFKVGPSSIDEFMILPEESLRRNLKLAELLSLLVILSPRFADFYRNVVRPDGPINSIYRVASLIAGLPPTLEERGAAELISATAIDADKIDYINRDAQACGIPVGIDFARLFLRSAFLKIDGADLERLTGQQGMPKSSMILIVNASGVDTIEELAHARTSLYHRVYLHQVTLCAEALLERGLRGIGEKGEQQSNVLSLWADSDDGLVQALAGSDHPDIRRYGQSLRVRQLPKRSLSVGKRLVMPRVNLAHFLTRLPSRVSAQLFKATVGPILEQLRGNSLGFEAIVADETSKLVIAVAKTRSDLVPVNTPKNGVMFLPIRDISAPHKDCLIVENGQVMYSSDRNIADEQNDALEIFKSQAYFVGPPEWREFNALAAAMVLGRLRSGWVTDYDFEPSSAEPDKVLRVKTITGMIVDLDASARRAGVDMIQLASIRTAAAAGGYFDECPQLYPHSLHCPKVAEIARRLNGFCGEGSWQVTTAGVQTFVTQFPPRLREDLLVALSRIHLLDRGVLATSMLVVLKTIAERNPGKRLIITGFSPDSGSLTRMLFEQELKGEAEKIGWLVRKDIEDALEALDERSMLVLCDDNTVSGSQASCQLRAWMGVPREKWPAEMRSEQGIFDRQLRAMDQKALSEKPWAIAVAVGTTEAESRVGEVATELGLSGFRGVFFHAPLDGVSLKAEGRLRDYLEEVGREVLAWARIGKSFSEISGDDKAACARDALGYNGQQGLLATVFNVPVSTCAALWCPGVFRNQPWVPLMIRRGYLKKLVVG